MTAATAVAGRTTPTGTPVRYSVVGTGYFGAELARALSVLPGAVVTSVHDPAHAGPVAREVGARATTLEDACTAADVDVVVVASPNADHLRPVLTAARAGKHVFCEKPIALSYDDCAQMLQATRDAGVLLMAGHVMRFMAGVREARRAVDAGDVGELLVARAVRTGWEDRRPSVSWKKQRSTSGGHLYHHIHELDLVQSFMGPAHTATMVGGNLAHQGPGHGDEDDVLLITLQMGEDGAAPRFAVLEYGSAFRWPEHHVLLQGTLGAVRIDLLDPGVEIRTATSTRRVLLHRDEAEDADRRAQYRGRATDGAIRFGTPSDRVPRWLRGVVEEEVRHLHRLLTHGPSADDREMAALTDGTAATQAIATADACTRSLVEGRPVPVAEVTGVPR